mgnify:FL=1
MEFRKRLDRIWLEDEAGREVAFVSFPAQDEHTVTILSTVVDDTLRGQGVAGALLDALAQELRASGRKAVPVCSYAVQWFRRHPEQADLLVQDGR